MQNKDSCSLSPAPSPGQDGEVNDGDDVGDDDGDDDGDANGDDDGDDDDAE